MNRVCSVGAGLQCLAVLFWSLLAGLSLAYSLQVLDGQEREVALARARMVSAVIETTRLWNASHGGVYVAVDERTPPNPYLDPKDRDAELFGRPFTKVNPAYMTRQISELVERQNGITFRLTSLTPLRPANEADPWEASVLRMMEQGLTELVQRVEYRGEASFRYMARLKVEEPCLGCHSAQGYALGQVRGGLSVSIPARGVLAEMQPYRRQAMVVHAVGWLLLCGVSALFISWLRRDWRELAAAKAEQERMVAARTVALTAANAELARSNAELENFAYVASHDMQEPLRMIGSYARLIETRYRDRLDADGLEFLSYMTGGAARLKEMIDDLLSYSRVDRGPLQLRPVAMQTVLEMARLNLDAAIRESGAVVACPQPLPEVAGEAALLARLMQNLLGNALKYRRPDVPPRVEITATRQDEQWLFSVRDNGIGIPAGERERIFNIFQRLHSHAAYPGTGIGLAICRKIIERHGGLIWVQATDSGADFRFTLPSVAAAAAEIVAATE